MMVADVVSGARRRGKTLTSRMDDGLWVLVWSGLVWHGRGWNLCGRFRRGVRGFPRFLMPHEREAFGSVRGCRR